jgi:putative transposase
MARKPRVEFEGALYHVIARGNQRQKIFLDDQDRLTYLDRVERYRQRYGFKILRLCLNVHFLLEIGKTPLSKILKGFSLLTPSIITAVTEPSATSSKAGTKRSL